MRRGHTLLETMVAAAIFSALLLLVFGAFRWGSGAFQLSIGRQGLQTEGRRVMARLEQDLKQTARGTESILQRQTTVGGVTVDRDAICMATLSNWSDPTRFEPTTGLPLWDRYVVYYATQQLPGRLIRLEIDPAPDPASMPWSGFDAALLVDDPVVGGPILSKNVLAQHVLEFSVGYNATDGEVVEVSLKVSGTSSAPTGPRRTETLELLLGTRPNNSLP